MSENVLRKRNEAEVDVILKHGTLPLLNKSRNISFSVKSDTM